MACQCDMWNVECPVLGFFVKKSLWNFCQRNSGHVAPADKTNILTSPEFNKPIEFDLTPNKLGVMEEVKNSESRLS